MTEKTALQLAYSMGYEDKMAGRMHDPSKVESLGRGTCKNVHEPPMNTAFWPATHFKCSECGSTHVSMEYVFYCPNCGREVEE